jgi:NAD(P)H-hydrate epimerase
MINSSPAPIILTPHIKEFSRLTKLSVSEILASPETHARAFCERHPNTVLALKSHRTIIAQNEKLLFNTAGNSGMAKGGSGDVLAGIIASLAAQGAKTFEAAAMGVHIHALAGDLAAEKLGKTAMLPSDIAEQLSGVYRAIEQ